MGCCFSCVKGGEVDIDEWAISSEEVEREHSEDEGQSPVAETVDLISFLYLNNSTRASRRLNQRVRLINMLNENGG